MPSTSQILLLISCLSVVPSALALESDRQQPLEVNADSTDGMLGDGVTTLSGHVEIKQGTLLIKADRAEVDKTGGKVRQITLSGDTASLEQEIEGQGLVRAWAQTIEYKVGTGMVILVGAAEVKHPQYEVSGEQLRYDLNVQHFEGNGSQDGNGRVHIRLDPEVAPQPPDTPTDEQAIEPPEDSDGSGGQG